MFHTFHFHVSDTSPGVVVWLTAKSVPLEAHKGRAEEIADGLWLSVPESSAVQEGQSRGFPGLTAEEHQYLRLGLRIVSRQIRSHAPTRLPLVKCLETLLFNECDYQPEGLACAMAGWSSVEFGFPPIQIPVTFDRENKRCLFEFEQA